MTPKYLLILFLSLPIFAHSISTYEQKIVDKTFNYYDKQGVKKDKASLVKIMNAASLTARIFPEYETGTFEARTNKIYSISRKENDFCLGHVEVNIPGIYLPGVRKTIKRFSLDYGHSGLNQINATWTYKAALILQNETGIEKTKKLLALKKDWALGRGIEDELDEVVIPKNIKLKKLDLHLIKRAKIQYENMKRRGLSPTEIRLKIKLPFSENTQDEITSLTIYRVLVEINMNCLNMKKPPYDRQFYNYLRK